MKRAYVDTSAYLCVLLGETGHQTILKSLRECQLLTSSLMVLESRRNLLRLARASLLSPTQFNRAQERLSADLQLFRIRDLTLDLCDNRVIPALSTPKSLDLAHLRTALWFHREKPLNRFVTLDHNQRLAATELGLPV